MNQSLFPTACQAAAHIKNRAWSWILYFGQPCDREGLEVYAESLDKENMLAEAGCLYVAAENGSLGITVDGGKNIEWLAYADIQVAPEERMLIAETPTMVIKSEMREKIRSLRNLMTVKGVLSKVLITGGIILLIWLGLLLWQFACAKNGKEIPFVADVLAYITFANGGVSTNPLYLVGGFFGKTFVMGTVIALVLGGFRKLPKGIGRFGAYTIRLVNLKNIAIYLAGIGVACVLSNFFMGYACMAMTMVGVAGVVSSLQLLGGDKNFTRRMAVALTAHINPQSKVHYQDLEKAMIALAGLTLGFLLSIALSAVPGGFTPYIVGVGAGLIAAILLLISMALHTSASTVAKRIVMLALLVVPMGMGASDWYMKYVRTENVPNPESSANISTGNHNGITLTPPPRKIRKGDKVVLIASDEGKLRVFPALNCDFDGNPDPPYDELYSYWDFSTLYNEGGDYSRDYHGASELLGAREISREFKEDFFGTLDDDKEELPDGTEVAIVFQTKYGETRWIYRYHGDAPAKSAVDELLPSGLSEDEKIAAIIAILVSGGAGAIALILALLSDRARKRDDEGDGGDDLPTGPRPSDPYIRREADGTYVYVNPITREIDYLPPETDEEAVREQIETVLRNKEYYRRPYEQQRQWVAQERARVQNEIEKRNKAYDEYAKQKQINEAIAKKRDEYIQRLKDKYLVAFDDDGKDPNKTLRRYIREALNYESANYYKNMSLSDEIDAFSVGLKLAKDSADVSLDALAALGGKPAKTVRDIYKATAELTSSVSTAVAKNQSIPKAVTAGLVRAGITFAEYNTEGGAHAMTTIIGEGVRDYVTALEQGKTQAEAYEAFKNGLGRGLENQFVDYCTGKVADELNTLAKDKGMQDAFRQDTKGILNSETAKKIAESDTIKKIMEGETGKQLSDPKIVDKLIESFGASSDDILKLKADEFFE